MHSLIWTVSSLRVYMFSLLKKTIFVTFFLLRGGGVATIILQPICILVHTYYPDIPTSVTGKNNLLLNSVYG